MKTYFRQPCPICGRPLHVPIELLGSEASCNHCSGVFTAIGDETQEQHGSDDFSGSPHSEARDRGREMDIDLKRSSCIGVHTEALREKELV